MSGGGDERVRLAAVVRLMVEEVRDEQPFGRADLATGGAAEPLQIGIEPGVVDLGGPGRDPGIGLFARRTQRGPVGDEPVAFLDRGLRPRPVVEAAHPLVVAPQDVDQRAVQRTPERAVRVPPLGVAEAARGAVQSPVHLGVVGRHRADIGGRDHRALPVAVQIPFAGSRPAQQP
ncbi:hypothetical protein D3C83_18550 [compost metagenome]